MVRLNAGTYHVVSNYGDVNATIRADIQIEAGKLTEATIQHRAAKLTLKLVAGPGGEAIADTAWSILTASGDTVSESVGAFPTIVLARRRLHRGRPQQGQDLPARFHRARRRQHRCRGAALRTPGRTGPRAAAIAE